MIGAVDVKFTSSMTNLSTPRSSRRPPNEHDLHRPAAVHRVQIGLRPIGTLAGVYTVRARGTIENEQRRKEAWT